MNGYYKTATGKDPSVYREQALRSMFPSASDDNVQRRRGVRTWPAGFGNPLPEQTMNCQGPINNVMPLTDCQMNPPVGGSCSSCSGAGYNGLPRAPVNPTPMRYSDPADPYKNIVYNQPKLIESFGGSMEANVKWLLLLQILMIILVFIIILKR